MNIRITRITNIEGLAKAISNAKGKVELKTEDGDCYNLKSKLSQLISLNVLLCGTQNLKNTELCIEDPKDAVFLKQYIIGNPV